MNASYLLRFVIELQMGVIHLTAFSSSPSCGCAKTHMYPEIKRAPAFSCSAHACWLQMLHAEAVTLSYH